MDWEVKGKLAEMETKGKKCENFNIVTCEELLKSETYRLKILQEELYQSELKSLLLNDNVHKSSPLNPTLDNR